MAVNTNPRTEVFAGLVERVTFHNEDNGFCVLRVKARGKRDPITVVGHAAVISAGEFIQASGEWANDRTHGVQFRARFLKVTPPTTAEGIEKYLGSGMIRGIGPAYARKLVQAFGVQSASVKGSPRSPRPNAIALMEDISATRLSVSCYEDLADIRRPA
jgi:exodeoxyribonuclease V alpha subunit